MKKDYQKSGLHTLHSFGFTLIELMITVAIVAILSAIALPAYNQYVIRGNRAAAQAAMMDIANRQQQYFLTNRSYTATVGDLNYSLPTEVSGKYTLTLYTNKKLDSSCALADDSTAIPKYVIQLAATGTQASDGTLYLSSAGTKCPTSKW